MDHDQVPTIDPESLLCPANAKKYTVMVSFVRPTGPAQSAIVYNHGADAAKAAELAAGSVWDMLMRAGDDPEASAVWATAVFQDHIDPVWAEFEDDAEEGTEENDGEGAEG